VAGLASVPGLDGAEGRAPVDIERGCLSKQVYLSKAQAKAISRSMSSRHREALHIYACPSCRYWHVGHIEPAWLRARTVDNFERTAVRVA
jgi:hypothetical protein